MRKIVASIITQATPMEVYRAFSEPGAIEQWIAPSGMIARMIYFDFREGGLYRMRLTYIDTKLGHGKTSDDSDEFNVEFLSLIEGKLIDQRVVFKTATPSFSGPMRMIWSFKDVAGGTRVSIRAENVPTGINPQDHAEGLNSTLNNLDEFLRKNRSK